MKKAKTKSVIPAILYTNFPPSTVCGLAYKSMAGLKSHTKYKHQKLLGSGVRERTLLQDEGSLPAKDHIVW